MPFVRIRRFAILMLVLIQQAACSASIQEKIEHIIARKDQKNVEYSVMVVDAQTGKCVFSYNPATPLTPASNMKLITSFTALKRLGTDYKFVTRAGLIGNKLVVIGGGDPLLGFAGKDFIGQITEALKAKSIEKLDSITVDSSIFDSERINPNWPRDQLNRPYSSEISGLNYNGNCVKISAARTDSGIKLTKEPDTAFLRLLNNVKPISKGQSAIGSNRTEQANLIIVYGKCRNAASFDVTIEKPALFFGYLLTENLRRAGISVESPLTEMGVNQQDVQIIAEFNTPIMEVIQNCNKVSLQIAAECLLKTLAANTMTGGKAGSWQAGRKTIGSYLLSLGIDKTEFYIDDGSGLSNVNKLSANAISRVIMDAYKSRFWPEFKQTLSISGVDGTIKSRFNKNKYGGKVFGKSGYINGVRALSGVCVAENGGREYIFSIITNNANYPTKKAIADIVTTIIDE
ncbi:MAG: D-alanyl-D-alanine carboxypeptidase/D-alanyl-D-alanine-endopeptidase [Phycisphaerae bacterium]|jgi:D-alanyl-D-alanine carboxypeptidase/D-alanyl-D-alanine-endopeptidase (penicillin-binding protein 4)